MKKYNLAVPKTQDLHTVLRSGTFLVFSGQIICFLLLLGWEHRLVRANDLSRVGVAFFNANGVISVIYFATVLAATLIA